MKFFASCCRTSGNGKLIKEDLLNEVKFYRHKFNNRPIPQDKKKILIITCFTEFGCESLGLMYCIPKAIAHNPGAYVICAGWWGRSYLYKHLADEFWEVEESAMFMRDYANAFINTSRNVRKIEKLLANYGSVFHGEKMGHFCVANRCNICKKIWNSDEFQECCESCYSANIERAIFANIRYSKKFAVQVPRPSLKALESVKKYIKPKSVGIFARNRKLYGRNLNSSFYVMLIRQLQDKGYNPIWLGEKQSILPCPVEDILDFSSLPEARNLELTLALIANMEFTIQFWTASTRLSSMVGTPWILFETPDQIVGAGQEGKRIALTTDENKKKLILSHYFNVVEKPEEAYILIDKAIEEMKNDNWDDIVGLVEHPEVIKESLKKQLTWRDM